ncbi:type VII secretion protein EccB [Dactylosporangium sp. NBC_01737]|uniref:type VII secretion protein EccB n=1 Tax=Dactylosporangium sp. NBC_01737 TaxID=2975959 RepID=UPI002E14A19A|nr:type VII secretion protein EccB [Dactylosporangium sp. NBC_01737]
MTTKRDQTQAYFFLVGRLVAGLLNGEPDALQRPNRRPSVGTAVGVLLTILVAAGFGIYGLLRPGGPMSWRAKSGAIVLVEETGARYVYVDGTLFPVLNYASARLALGAEAPVEVVSRDSLSGLPVGAPIGIPGAPDGLPSRASLYTGPWSVCARPSLGSSRPSALTTVVFGAAGAAAPALSDDQALLVSTSDGKVFLIWHGRRYRIASAAALVALGYGSLNRLPVTEAWINPVPAGPDLGFPPVTGRGRPGPTLGGAPGVVGRVYEWHNPALSTSELFLLRTDGLALLSRTVAALVLADPATKAAYGDAPVRRVPIGADEVAAARVVDLTTFVTNFPPEPPRAANNTGADVACVRHTLDATAPSVAATLMPPAALASAVSLAGPAATRTTADEVVVAAASGVFARNAAAPGTVYLITESGVKYPIADEESLSALGYVAAAAVPVSGELLALLPTGPVLSTTAARATQPAGT